MDLWQAIKRDHETIETLFQKLLSDDAETETLLQQLATELEAHWESEREALYPELRKIDALAALVGQSLVEHAEIRKMLSQLGEAEEDELPDLIERLQEAVLDHFEEEEEDIIPVAEDEVSEERLRTMLTRFQAAKQAVLAKAK